MLHFLANFRQKKFIADGKNILIPEKNRISRIDGTATITNPITIQTELVKGKKVLEISENNKDTILSKLKLADTQNDKFQMKVSKQYNGTYITITQRVTSGGKLLIANEPFIGEAVEDSYATMRNEDCSVKTAVWSGYSHAAGSKWAAGDVPELTITLKVWSATERASRANILMRLSVHRISKCIPGKIWTPIRTRIRIQT